MQVAKLKGRKTTHVAKQMTLHFNSALCDHFELKQINRMGIGSSDSLQSDSPIAMLKHLEVAKT